ncbi:cytochrome c biogenesis protein CcmE [Bacterioplanes sanyensis]|uniref:Cytochrome c-type biogenesis protein CcmE n=1 Tax=Bacterioplanes sanyensis TaxID=1249553 RepID=A0A222FNI2_9GAMM|nr:cytochrome c maturation protein CcmE [Bacterioplanes sanyensis]ASP40242.1 cytochrome c biogenesis protein CcmE [Bacterioplanes sanyensis]
MHPQRKKRLTLILFLLVGVSTGVGLMAYSLTQNINLFQTPTQIAAGEVPVGRTIRAGGLVVDGSVVRDTEGLGVTFKVTDGAASVPIYYDGILPDLFREGQGIVALGQLNEKGVLQASEVLAKHDENYMPPEVQEALEKAHQDGKGNLKAAGNDYEY